MNQGLAKKRFVAAALPAALPALLLIFTIMGASLLPNYACFEKLAGKSHAQSVFLMQGGQIVDCLAVSGTKDSAYAPRQSSLPRIMVPLSLLAAGAGMLCAEVKPATQKVPESIKNSIILKLRI